MKNLVLITALVFSLSSIYSSHGNEAYAAKKDAKKNSAKKSSSSKGAEELKIEDIKIGKGAVAESGKKVTVHYTGWLTNGKKFDSSLDAKEPFTFQLGAAQVIQGWDKGVVGMKIGGKRKLTIPAKMGYGERGAGNVIPPNSTLVFEVELLKVENL